MKFFGQQRQINTPQPIGAARPSQPEIPSVQQIHTQQLSDEQKLVIEELKKGNSVVVDSCIGSGKTFAIQCVCNEFPDRRILYLTYNRLLKMDAQDKITNRNTTVQNYHGFVYKYLIRRNIKVAPDKQIKAFLEKCTDIPLVYDLICIDEYQDLEEDTVQLLLHLAKECPQAQWVFVGDMAQKIYDKTKVNVYKDCIEKIAPNYVPLAFTKSFRISAQLADTLSNMWGKRIVGVNSDCAVEETQDFKEILWLLDQTPNKDVLILGPRYGLTQELVNILERHNPQKYNKQTVWTSIRDKDENFRIQPDSLIVTTYDGCKGMERPVCVVIDWTNSHFKNRVEKPFVDQNIIRNLFCVAASRGKKQIVFYRDPTHKDEHFLELADLTLSYSQDLPDFEPSTMFGFKHPADIARCMEDIEIEDIPQDETAQIDAITADGNIDLSPAVGIFQEITFFKKYDFDKAVNRLQEKPILTRIRKWMSEQSALTDEQKALALTAYETELFRYCKQATPEFMDKQNHELLISRLSSKLDAESSRIQVPCHVVAEFTASGYMDYVDDKNIPWELKFVSSLNNEHYLQTAMYVVAKKAPFAYLWNVRTNELKKVKVKNVQKFLEDTYTCITMGRKLRRH
ncbi:MAG: AAA family ATPase [Acetobacter sp.]|nr:AAA family ATPase [Acetobacter sp.]